MAKKANKNTKKQPTKTTDRSAVTTVEETQVEAPVELLFSKGNLQLMLIGIAVMVLGYFLMSGGRMPSSDMWDDDIIYSFRRTTLAPIVILTGLVIEVFAIFKK